MGGGIGGAPIKKWASIFLFYSYPENPPQELEVGARRAPYLLVFIYMKLILHCTGTNINNTNIMNVYEHS